MKWRKFPPYFSSLSVSVRPPPLEVDCLFFPVGLLPSLSGHLYTGSQRWHVAVIVSYGVAEGGICAPLDALASQCSCDWRIG